MNQRLLWSAKTREHKAGRDQKTEDCILTMETLIEVQKIGVSRSQKIWNWSNWVLAINRRNGSQDESSTKAREAVADWERVAKKSNAPYRDDRDEGVWKCTFTCTLWFRVMMIDCYAYRKASRMSKLICTTSQFKCIPGLKRRNLKMVWSIWSCYCGSGFEPRERWELLGFWQMLSWHVFD